MTLRELIEIMRDTLDDKGGSNVDWTDSSVQSLLRWSNEELTRYINAAERETALRTHSLIESQLQSVSRISITTGTDIYKLHPKIITVERAKLSGQRQPLIEISWRDAEALRTDWDSYAATPEYYMRDYQQGKIRLYPTPIEDDTLNLIVYRLPLNNMDLENWESDDPEIDEHYQDKMLSWAYHLAYQKDEPNTLDPDKVMFYLQKFEKEIGSESSMYSFERRRRKDRGTPYSGLRHSGLTSNTRIR